jgi:hypothetical protein
MTRPRWWMAGSLMLLVTTLVYGLELPAVEPGDTCEHAAEVELAANAHPVNPIPQMISNGLLGFNEISTPDLRKQIIYACDSNGHIAHYLINFRIKDQQRAKALYAEIKADLRSRGGPPDTDSDRFTAVQKKLLAGLFTSDSSTWKNFYGKEVSLNLDLPDPLGDSKIAVGIHPSKR